jgi:hypothetical protein
MSGRIGIRSGPMPDKDWSRSLTGVLLPDSMVTPAIGARDMSMQILKAALIVSFSAASPVMALDGDPDIGTWIRLNYAIKSDSKPHSLCYLDHAPCSTWFVVECHAPNVYALVITQNEVIPGPIMLRVNLFTGSSGSSGFNVSGEARPPQFKNAASSMITAALSSEQFAEFFKDWSAIGIVAVTGDGPYIYTRTSRNREAFAALATECNHYPK